MRHMIRVCGMMAVVVALVAPASAAVPSRVEFTSLDAVSG